MPAYSIATTGSTNEYEFDGSTGYLYFTPANAGTFTFACTASNTLGTAVNTLTVTVFPAPGTAPAWSADFPAAWTMTAGDIDGFDVADYLTGDPAPAVTLATDAPSGDYVFENGEFTYMPTETGIFTFTFTFTADNGVGEPATATLTVTVTAEPEPLTPFEQWLADNNYGEHTEAEMAPNGHTYWDNYLADIAPGDAFLAIEIADPSAGTFTLPAASSNRAYHLLYWTDLHEGPATNNLPAPSAFTLPADATGFGRIRVTLPAP